MSFRLATLAFLASLAMSLAKAQDPDLFDTSILRTFSLTFEQDDWWQRLKNNKDNQNGKYLRATLEVDGIEYQRVGVRFRGKASYFAANGIKLPFKIKFDEFKAGQEVYGYDSIRLNNSWEDPSMMRDVLMAKLLEDFMPMSRQAFCKLVINDENWGVYVTEETKDLKYMRAGWQNPTGNRYKSTEGANLSYLGADPGPYRNVYFDKSNNGDDSYADLIHFCDVLNNTPTGPTLTDAMRPIMDIDETLWTIAGDNVCGNLDSYFVNRNNYYMIQDERHGLMSLINHDLGLSFGTWGGQDAQMDPFYDFNSGLIPLIRNLFKDARMKKEYLAHVQTLNEEVMRWDVAGPLVTAYRDLIRDEVYLDDKKLFTNDDFDNCLDQDINGGFFLIPALRIYIQDRHAFLNNHDRVSRTRAEFGAVAHSPLEPRAGEQVKITAEIVGAALANRVELRWRTTGPLTSVKMRDDGTRGDEVAGDRVYTYVLPALPAGAQVEYCFISRESTLKELRFEPRNGLRASYRFFVEGATGSGLVISEFLARNNNGLMDEAGDRDDWLEIANQDTVARDLSGMYLSDDLRRPRGWKIPDGTVLQPEERLLVWADDEEAQGPYHANFKLGGSGEHIALFDTDGATLLSSVVFRAQEEDRSTGRLLRDPDPLVSFREPTPAESNKAPNGARHYSALHAAANPVVLRFVGNANEGEIVSIQIDNGPPDSFTLIYLSLAPDSLWTRDGVWLLDVAASSQFLIPLDSAGQASLPFVIPSDGSITNLDLYFQNLALDSNGNFLLSNALELRVGQ